MFADFSLAKEFSSRFDAEMAGSLLRCAQIEYRIISDDAGGMDPHLASAYGVQLVVPIRQMEEAKRILSQAETDTADPKKIPKPWTCVWCKEELEGNFTECWKCGASRGNRT